MSKSVEIGHVRISSLAAPTAEDIAVLESLSDEQYRALLSREIEAGFNSGASDATLDDIWQEALRRATAKAKAADAL